MTYEQLKKAVNDLLFHVEQLTEKVDYLEKQLKKKELFHVEHSESYDTSIRYIEYSKGKEAARIESIIRAQEFDEYLFQKYKYCK